MAVTSTSWFYWAIFSAVFAGLALSLIFGIFVSTVLTLVVIPVLYYAAMKNRIHAA